VTRGQFSWWAATAGGLLACALAVGWWAARPAADANPARAREAALADGRADLTALSSADGAAASGSLRAWLAATTGTLHDGLQRGSATSLSELTSSGTDARGSVTAAALTALDPDHGTATLLATLSVQVSATGTTEQTQQRGVQAQLVRTGGDWKVSALTTLVDGSSADGDS
jgi:Mce-associated membrane protein